MNLSTHAAIAGNFDFNHNTINKRLIDVGGKYRRVLNTKVL